MKINVTTNTTVLKNGKREVTIHMTRRIHRAKLWEMVQKATQQLNKENR
jgi:hypothetical protein